MCNEGALRRAYALSQLSNQINQYPLSSPLIDRSLSVTIDHYRSISLMIDGSGHIFSIRIIFVALFPSHSFTVAATSIASIEVLESNPK